MKKGRDHVLQHIANHLMINSSYLSDLSLYHGKMGIVLFFYHYARYTKNPLYEEFAGDLLDEIFDETPDNTEVYFERGLSGIAWGILYLLRNQFVGGDPDNILEDIDMKIMETNLLRVRDNSIEKGIAGLLAYFSFRLSFQKDHSYFDEEFMSDWQKVTSDKGEYMNLDISAIIGQNTHSSVEEIKTTSLGIRDGYAGYGLKLIME